jgi:hypothetical protein
MTLGGKPWGVEELKQRRIGLGMGQGEDLEPVLKEGGWG